MTRKFVTMLMVALVMFASTSVLMPARAAAAPKNNAVNATSLVQAPASLSGAAGTLQGLLTVTGTSLTGGALSLTGTLVGTFTDAVTGATTAINTTFTALLQNASASCTILTLTLGPLHLDLLGLVVDLNQIVLNITAQPGAGNLLGNLLCDIANLLNNGGPLQTLLTQLQTLLNQILGGL